MVSGVMFAAEMVTGNPRADALAVQPEEPHTTAGWPAAVNGKFQSGIAGIVGVRSRFAVLGQITPGTAGLIHDRLYSGAE